MQHFLDYQTCFEIHQLFWKLNNNFYIHKDFKNSWTFFIFTTFSNFWNIFYEKSLPQTVRKNGVDKSRMNFFSRGYIYWAGQVEPLSPHLRRYHSWVFREQLTRGNPLRGDLQGSFLVPSEHAKWCVQLLPHVSCWPLLLNFVFFIFFVCVFRF